MFWGLILQPNKSYTQIVKKSFHVSMACLDVRNSEDGLVQLYLNYEGKIFLLCNLKKDLLCQVPLDINIKKGDRVVLTCIGRGIIHLTGYLLDDEDYSSEDEKEIEDKKNEKQNAVDKHPKRKAVESPQKDQNKIKRMKQEKAKSLDNDLESIDEDDENDSEDSENEDDFEQTDEQEDDSDEDDSNEDEEEESYEEQEYKHKKPMKSQQPEKKGKQSQEIQQDQQKKKHEKKKSVNGEDGKQGQQTKQKKIKTDQQSNQLNKIQTERKKKVLNGGLQIEDFIIGNGKIAKSEKTISIYFECRSMDGKKIYSVMQGAGCVFKIGEPDVMKGFNIGIVGMKIGGKRRIIVPPRLTHTAKCLEPVFGIPLNTTVVFDVELRTVF